MSELEKLASEAAALDAELKGADAPYSSAPDGMGAGQAGAAESGAAPAAGPSPQEAAEKEVRMVLELMCGMLKPLSPSAAAVYTPSVVEDVARTVGAVLVKYKVTLLGLLGRFEVEIKCAVVVGPVVWHTVKAIRDDMEARAAAAARPVNAPPVDSQQRDAFHA